MFCTNLVFLQLCLAIAKNLCSITVHQYFFPLHTSITSHRIQHTIRIWTSEMKIDATDYDVKVETLAILKIYYSPITHNLRRPLMVIKASDGVLW